MIGKYFGYFWIVFLLFFIFIFPVIIHTNVPSYPTLAERNGITSLLYLSLSIFLWLGIFTIIFNYLYKTSFKARRNIEYILKKGKTIVAQIIDSKNITQYLYKKMDYKSLVLEFKNLSNETVWHRMDIIDSRPEEKRYEKGHQITLKIEETFTKPPFGVIEGMKAKVNYLPYLVFLFSILVILGEYLYFYHTENDGYGWRFLQFWHPLIISPLSIFLYGGIFSFIFSNKQIKNTFIGDNKQFSKLKMKGIKTTAHILHITQTGLYINEQPQVKFELEFTDQLGTIYQLNIKKIISLLEIHNIHTTEKEIFYLQENPKIFDFADEINAI